MTSPEGTLWLHVKQTMNHFQVPAFPMDNLSIVVGIPDGNPLSYSWPVSPMERCPVGRLQNDTYPRLMFAGNQRKHPYRPAIHADPTPT